MACTQLPNIKTNLYVFKCSECGFVLGFGTENLDNAEDNIWTRCPGCDQLLIIGKKINA